MAPTDTLLDCQRMCQEPRHVSDRACYSSQPEDGERSAVRHGGHGNNPQLCATVGWTRNSPVPVMNCQKDLHT